MFPIPDTSQTNGAADSRQRALSHVSVPLRRPSKYQHLFSVPRRAHDHADAPPRDILIEAISQKTSRIAKPASIVPHQPPKRTARSNTLLCVPSPAGPLGSMPRGQGARDVDPRAVLCYAVTRSAHFSAHEPVLPYAPLRELYWPACQSFCKPHKQHHGH